MAITVNLDVTLRSPVGCATWVPAPDKESGGPPREPAALT
jgi:hypothetical protein